MSFGIVSIIKNYMDSPPHEAPTLEKSKGGKIFKVLFVLDCGIALSSLIFAILVMTSVMPLPPAAMWSFFGVGIGIIGLDALVISLCPDNFRTCIGHGLFGDSYTL